MVALSSRLIFPLAAALVLLPDSQQLKFGQPSPNSPLSSRLWTLLYPSPAPPLLVPFLPLIPNPPWARGGGSHDSCPPGLRPGGAGGQDGGSPGQHGLVQPETAWGKRYPESGWEWGSGSCLTGPRVSMTGQGRASPPTAAGPFVPLAARRRRERRRKTPGGGCQGNRRPHVTR